MAEAQQTQQAAPQPQQEPAQEKKKVVRRKTSTKSKAILVRSKRKMAVARASVQSGSGKIRVNSVDINAIESPLIKNMTLDPINISNLAKDIHKKADITITVYGGGVSAQMQAVRSAIAKGLVAFSGNEALKVEFMNYDRALLVDDPRRIEPKKFDGPKARARNQTSYR